MSGFLADRLSYWNNDKPEKLTDYGLLDDFTIPIQDLEQLDPDNLPEDNPWYIPEPNIAIIKADNHSANDVIDSIICAPDFHWEKWITINNIDRQYKVDNDTLLALYNYSHFDGSAGVETCLFISSIIINNDEINAFVDMLDNDKDLSKKISNPTDWHGGIISSCYITPKEVCWFPWKKRCDSYHIEKFPDFSMQSAVDKCCYNYPEYNDVYYNIPSEPIRKLLGIVDSNGYLFYDNNKVIKAQYSISGDRWYTFQNYLLIEKKALLDVLQNSGKSLIWIMREYRREDGKSKELFGEFYADKDKSYIGYFENGSFVIKSINKEITHSFKHNNR